ncbi:hypothetical protein [Deinococcus roseus]|uniref:DUF3299 domain-containing protein n=1 Tax=Deinococcus roseus TaxID=392414 RepID=A0ABQ2CZE1_9DEIO|nr:hypothetical protein [Deinococcus roseus]GGJ32238.1 hypothetical protein GCM10008938_18050 [Deinococcus roseus]
MKKLLVVLLFLLGLSHAQTPIKFTELYSEVTVRGIEFSPILKKQNGQQVKMVGYMAPPLKPKLDFFVLTRTPMATCPFCTTAADWPPDIVLVIMPEGKELDPSTRKLEVTGKLEVGIKEDPQTGFVSLVRIYAKQVKEL